MRTIWIGWDLIVGIAVVLMVTIAIGLVLAIRSWKKVRAIRLSARFVDAGFTWEYKLQGWLSRDPYNQDWILWDERNKRMLRLPDREDADWRPSEETLQQCIELGQKYCGRLREPLREYPQ
jgi:hypothetical protein